MKTIQTKILVFITSILLACSEQANESNVTTTVKDTVPVTTPSVQKEVADSAADYSYEEPETNLSGETRIRFQNFSVVLHNFKGYDADGEFGSRTYTGQFGGGSLLNEAQLNDDETEKEDYTETLVALKDSVQISESLGGNDWRINKTLLQILPKSRDDTYKVSYCYLTNLYEMFDHRKLSEEEWSKLSENRFTKKESSEYVSLKDSADLYFPLIVLNDDNEQAWYINGAMSKSYYQRDLNRIKNKYNLKDTLIMFSGEGGSYYATLKKENKIFGYDAESYLIRIERYTQNKLIESKYIVIYIAYGC